MSIASPRANAAVLWLAMDSSQAKGQRVGVAIAMLVGTVSACGSGDGIPLDDFLAAQIAAECSMLTRCHLASNEAYCVSLASVNGDRPSFGNLAADVAAAKAGKAKYDDKKARACLNALASVDCNGLDDRMRNRDVCQGLFSGGTLADGVLCRASAECLPGSYCNFTITDRCAGICTLGGTECREDSQCSNGQVCDTSYSTGTCVDPKPAGSAGNPCGTDGSCEAGLFCSMWNGCQPLAKEGESCELPFGCADGLVCTSSAETPNPSTICRKIAAKGEPCQAVNQCGGLVLSAIHCDGTSQVCVDNTSDGPCFSKDSFYAVANGCDPFTSYCDGSTSTLTCKPYSLAVGDPCNVSILECGLSAWCQPDPANLSTGLCVASTVCAQ